VRRIKPSETILLPGKMSGREALNTFGFVVEGVCLVSMVGLDLVDVCLVSLVGLDMVDVCLTIKIEVVVIVPDSDIQVQQALFIPHMKMKNRTNVCRRV
jgi:hypothetical protein